MKAHLLIFRLTPFVLMAITAGGLWMGKGWVWLGPLTIFGAHPLLDQIVGNKLKCDDGEVFQGLHETTLFLYPFFQATFLIFAGATYWNHISTSSPFILLGIILAAGAITGGIGLTVAHELVHRSGQFSRGLGVFLLAMVNYSHFRIEHVYGHHRKVATPEDAAFAPEGEGLYSYLPRAIYQGFKSAWKIEQKVARSHIKNRMFHYLVISAIGSGLLILISPHLLLFWWGQSIVAIILVEAVNYIEHYGLERQKSAGRYEKVTYLHSWDSDFGLTNHSLFNLGKHAHHHADASKHFYRLNNSPQASDLPVGYAGAIVLAFFPPIWKKMMGNALARRRESMG